MLSYKIFEPFVAIVMILTLEKTAHPFEYVGRTVG